MSETPPFPLVVMGLVKGWEAEHVVGPLPRCHCSRLDAAALGTSSEMGLACFVLVGGVTTV